MLFSRFQKEAGAVAVNAETPVASVSKYAAEHNMRFLEAAFEMRDLGMIPKDDPRLHIAPVRVRSLTERRMTELLNDVEAIAHRGRSADDRALRTQFASIEKVAQENSALFQHNPARRSDIASSTELMAVRLAKSDPSGEKAHELLEISAAVTDSLQRDRASIGFEKGNIAAAAKAQGRSWVEVRDDLAKFDLIPENDPRRKIRAADVQGQKGGVILSANTLPAADLEGLAMSRLARNPTDDVAVAYLATAGALCEPQPITTAKVPRTKRKLFSRRPDDLEIG